MKPKDQILARMYVALTLLGLAPLAIAVQMGQIVVTETDTLRDQVRAQARSSVTIPAMRGAILDRNGRGLATNTARYDLSVDPTVEGFQKQAGTFFDKLGSLTGVSASRYRRQVRNRHSPQYVKLREELTPGQHETIQEWDVPGVILTPEFGRRYNYGTTAAHVIGHVGDGGHGLAGLELAYDDTLTGTPGRRIVRRDRSGRIEAYVGGTVVQPERGDDLLLTLDLTRQAALENELRRGVRESGAEWGTAVAMDPSTGGILALANVPTYDPSRPGRASAAARRNRALTDRFEPGSTFKLVGATAAIEQDLVSLDDSVETGDGWAVFHGYTMKDVQAHGTISFADVIAKSSNVGMAKTVTKLDRGTFYQYARNMGFSQPTWVDLPGEVGGVLKRTPQWSATTQTSMAIGYEVSVTPLQLLTAYSALANGGLIKRPYVVAERRDVTGKTLWKNEPETIRRAFRQETADTLRSAFKRVVERGTGTNAQVEGLRVAGKTGTALQVAEGEYSADETRASFVGFFPADAPEVALLVVLGSPTGGPHGGEVAAPVFRRVARRWAGTFPTVVARTTPEPLSVSAASSVDARPPTDTLPPGRPDVMPDLTGLSTRRAVTWLRKRDIEPQLQGMGTVVQQRPRPGAALPTTRVLLTAAE
ncbi:penicillin-binding transpeptidase domain-containing protein [Salinibacter altiplanensis]|uniref:penicillin-binding transpeptidase domain-containing protein n=1 Tax=Salinibacter altiplanensis TaxID=1803181 RepID=UPI000C9FC4EA|nr:penicillin-binding transpeptidase domain-containing protein [Salinibacter altiplanensis]